MSRYVMLSPYNKHFETFPTNANVFAIQFPLTIEDYVHRIGRTGRAGKTGEAITFFTVQDKPHSGS